MLRLLCIKLFLLVVCCCYGPVANGQALIALVFGKKLTTDRVKMGLQLGLHESFISNVPPGWRPRTSFAIGAYTDVQLGALDGKWSVSTYMLFKSPKGINHLDVAEQITEQPDSTFDKLSINRKITYFEILPFIRYRIKGYWFCGVGLDMAARTLARDEFTATEDEAKLTYTVRSRKDLTAFDFGFAAGIQYKMLHGRGPKLSFHFSQGLINIYKDPGKSGVNSTFHFGVGIPVGG
jgi:hypothetical protein